MGCETVELHSVDKLHSQVLVGKTHVLIRLSGDRRKISPLFTPYTSSSLHMASITGEGKAGLYPMRERAFGLKGG